MSEPTADELARREKVRERTRRWRDANREHVRAADRAYYEAHKEQREAVRRYRAAHPERRREQEAKRRANNRDQLRAKDAVRRHGPGIAATFAAMWDSQGGLCYLCETPLIRKLTHVDHDHTCCPQKRSCSYCQRGLACVSCNTLIGLVADDPEKLRRIADNLEAVLGAVRARIQMKPEQPELPLRPAAGE